MILLKISLIISAIVFTFFILNQKEIIKQIEEEQHPFIRANFVFKVTLIVSLVPGFNVYFLFQIIKEYIISFFSTEEEEEEENEDEQN